MNTFRGKFNELFLFPLQSYPQFQDFIVVHDYLVTPNSRMQARIRRRGQNGKKDLLISYLSDYQRRINIILRVSIALKEHSTHLTVLCMLPFFYFIVRWDNEKKCWDLETGKIGSVYNTPSVGWRSPLTFYQLINITLDICSVEKNYTGYVTLCRIFHLQHN